MKNINYAIGPDGESEKIRKIIRKILLKMEIDRKNNILEGHYLRKELEKLNN